ncbi:kelch-like protein 24 [Ptychodera flava]|uniref:kelch-like protein 24 n=1 Tax=Ptychodera flava TaxID=63121 RepID=UPI00396A601B
MAAREVKPKEKSNSVGNTNAIAQELNQLRLDNVLTDVYLCSRGVEFPCHRVVLAAASPFLRGVLKKSTGASEQSNRIPFDKLQPTLLEHVIEFIYSGRTTIHYGEVNKLLEVAKVFEMSDLTTACLSTLTSSSSDDEEQQDGENVKETRTCVSTGPFCVHHPTHVINLIKGFNKLKKREEFTDVCFLVGAQQIPCHRIVLLPHSNYFKAMFTTDMKESKLHQIEIYNISPETLRQIIEYAYSSKIDINNDNVGTLLEASSLFQILPVQNACVTYMQDQMDASNCLGIQAITDVFSCKPLCNKALDYAIENFDDVCLYEEFLSLSKERLADLIQKDLCVTREEAVYEAVIRWVEFDPDSRKHSFERLFKLIRLQYVSYTYLREKILTEALVMHSRECLEWVDRLKLGKLLPVPKRPYNEVLVNIHGYNYNGNHGAEVVDKIQCYDPKKDKWFTIKNCSLDSKDRVASAARVADDVFVLTKAGRAWMYRSKVKEWVPCRSLFRPRRNHQLVSIGLMVYKLGGQDGHNWSRTVDRYCSATDDWVQVAPMLGTRCIAATVCEGKIYAVTGSNNGFECYDPEKNAWTLITTLPEPESAQAVVLNRQIYILMHGCNFLCYSLQESQWKYVGKLASRKSRRFACRLAVCNGKIYAIGGCDKKYQNINTVDWYNVDTGKWEMVSNMPHAAWAHCCVTMHKYAMM